MTVLPNPFLNPSVIRPRTERSAVASKPPPVAGATAAPFSVLPGELQGLYQRDGESDPSAGEAIQSSCGGQWPTDVAPVSNLGNRLHHPSSPVASGHGIDPTGPHDQHGDVNKMMPEPSIAMEVPSEASAPAPTKNPDADALGTDCIHEIFAGAAKIDDYRFDAEFDEAAFLYAIEEGEEMPLFVRDGLHLQRWA